MEMYGLAMIDECRRRSGTPLVVQCLRLHAPKAGGLGSIPGQETSSHVPLLRPGTAEKKKKDGFCLKKLNTEEDLWENEVIFINLGKKIRTRNA